MQSIKVEGHLVNDSGGSRLRHKNRLLPIILVILFSVVYIFGYRGYIIDQINSEEFSNAHATIEQLSKQYGYVDKSSLILEELLDTDDDVIDGILTKVRYLDRQNFSEEDYVKYTDVRDYYVDILYAPYRLTMMSIILTPLTLAFTVAVIKF